MKNKLNLTEMKVLNTLQGLAIDNIVIGYSQYEIFIKAGYVMSNGSINTFHRKTLNDLKTKGYINRTDTKNGIRLLKNVKISKSDIDTIERGKVMTCEDFYFKLKELADDDGVINIPSYELAQQIGYCDGSAQGYLKNIGKLLDEGKISKFKIGVKVYHKLINSDKLPESTSKIIEEIEEVVVTSTIKEDEVDELFNTIRNQLQNQVEDRFKKAKELVLKYKKESEDNKERIKVLENINNKYRIKTMELQERINELKW